MIFCRSVGAQFVRAQLIAPLLFFLMPLFSFAENISITGSDGVVVNLNKPAHRVISLAPNLTEILFSIGAGNLIVGVGEDSDFPKAAQDIPIVAGIRTINLERILGLKPDLIIVWEDGTSPLAIESLRELHIPVLVTQSEHLSDIPILMQNLGVLTGQGPEGLVEAQKFKKTLNFYENMGLEKKSKIKVFIQIGLPPLFTAGGESIQSEIINICGGENVFNDIPRAASEVSMEAVMVKNPDLIIGMAPFDKAIWNDFEDLNAVKNKAELAINPDLFARNGPRVLLAVKQVCEAISNIKN